MKFFLNTFLICVFFGCRANEIPKVKSEELTLGETILRDRLRCPPTRGSYFSCTSMDRTENEVRVSGDTFSALRFQCANFGSTNAVNMTDLTVHAIGDDDGDITLIDADLDLPSAIMRCSVFDDTTGMMYDTRTFSRTSPNTLLFEINRTVPAHAVAKFNIQCTFSRTPPQDLSPDLFSFAIPSNGITAENSMTGGVLNSYQISIGDDRNGINVRQERTVTELAHGELLVQSSYIQSGYIMPGTNGVQVLTVCGKGLYEDLLVEEYPLRIVQDDCSAGGNGIISAIRMEYEDIVTGAIVTTSQLLNDEGYVVLSSGQNHKYPMQRESCAVFYADIVNDAEIGTRFHVEAPFGDSRVEIIGSVSGVAMQHSNMTLRGGTFTIIAQ